MDSTHPPYHPPAKSTDSAQYPSTISSTHPDLWLLLRLWLIHRLYPSTILSTHPPNPKTFYLPTHHIIHPPTLLTNRSRRFPKADVILKAFSMRSVSLASHLHCKDPWPPILKLPTTCRTIGFNSPPAPTQSLFASRSTRTLAVPIGS